MSLQGIITYSYGILQAFVGAIELALDLYFCKRYTFAAPVAFLHEISFTNKLISAQKI